MRDLVSFKQAGSNSRWPVMGIALRGSISRAWYALTTRAFTSYRPDRYYMRGPGPKWHEKHGRLIHSLDVAHHN